MAPRQEGMGGKVHPIRGRVPLLLPSPGDAALDESRMMQMQMGMMGGGAQPGQPWNAKAAFASVSSRASLPAARLACSTHRPVPGWCPPRQEASALSVAQHQSALVTAEEQLIAAGRETLRLRAPSAGGA